MSQERQNHSQSRNTGLRGKRTPLMLGTLLIRETELDSLLRRRRKRGMISQTTQPWPHLRELLVGAAVCP